MLLYWNALNRLTLAQNLPTTWRIIMGFAKSSVWKVMRFHKMLTAMTMVTCGVKPIRSREWGVGELASSLTEYSMTAVVTGSQWLPFWNFPSAC